MSSNNQIKKNPVGKPRKIKSPDEMTKKWEEYKNYCDNCSVTVHEFSGKSSMFISEILQKSITYTIEGFCIFIGLARAAFFETYAKDTEYIDLVTQIREECEVDARKKFELGVIPSQLSGLWMGRYGYTTKTDSNITGNLSVQEGKLDGILEQLKDDIPEKKG